MLYSLEQLEAFILATETGSFSAAARKLGKAQSRVSESIANLEIDLGLQLFDRSGKYPVLTEEGEALLPYTRKVIRECRALNDYAEQLSGVEQGQLRISVDELFPSEILGNVLGEFSKQFPEINVEVLWTAIGDVHELIKSGRADIGISLPFDGVIGDDCSWRTLGTVWFTGVVAATHPLAKLESVSEDDLWQHIQVIASSRSGREEADAYRFSGRLWRCEDSQLMREVVLNGVGWAWLARHYTQKYIDEGLLVELPLKMSMEYVPSHFYLEWKKDFPLRPAEEWFATSLARCFASLGEM